MTRKEEIYLDELNDKATEAWTRAFLAAKELERHEGDLFFTDRQHLLEEGQAAWKEYERLHKEAETLNRKHFDDLTAEFRYRLDEKGIHYTDYRC